MHDEAYARVRLSTTRPVLAVSTWSLTEDSLAHALRRALHDHARSARDVADTRSGKGAARGHHRRPTGRLGAPHPEAVSGQEDVKTMAEQTY